MPNEKGLTSLGDFLPDIPTANFHNHFARLNPTAPILETSLPLSHALLITFDTYGNIRKDTKVELGALDGFDLSADGRLT